MKYYCPKCDRHHYRGKIYEEHLKYKEETSEEIPDDEILDIPRNINLLAKKRIRTLNRKLEKESGNYYKVYVREINKVILNASTKKETT